MADNDNGEMSRQQTDTIIENGKPEPFPENESGKKGSACHMFDFDFKTGTIKGLNDTKNTFQHLEIPGNIGGRHVKKIGERAFYLCSNILGIYLSPSLRFLEIEKEAFSGCASLQSIDIPFSPNLSVSIDNGAFKNCTSLNHAKISNSVIFIGEGAFENCASLIVTCPKNSNIHKYCAKRNIQTQILFGNAEILTKKAARRLTAEAGFLNIPAEYSEIGKMAFSKRKDIVKAAIPRTIDIIGDYAFEKCGNLEHLSIPDSLAYIGKSAFWGCKKLKSIALPAHIEKIENSTFWGCGSITEITVPDKAVSMGKYAFWKCKGLACIKISSGVKDIGDGAFPDNQYLTVVCPQDSFTYQYCKKNNINTASY